MDGMPRDLSNTTLLLGFAGFVLVVLAVATTCVGIGSLGISQIAAIREFSMFACVGILSLLFLLLTFFPAALSLFPLSAHRKDRPSAVDRLLDDCLKRIVVLNIKHQKRCLTILIVLMIFFFLALPQMGIYLSGFFAGVTALGLNYGAYMSEIFRAGILSVSKGQHEAATALGMNARQKMLYIVLPQALRLAIPPMGNEYIAMLKDSALVSVTGFVREILWRAQRVGAQKFKNLEALLIAAVFYWILTLIFTALQTRLENRLGQGEAETKQISH